MQANRSSRSGCERPVQRRIGNQGLTGVLMSGGLDSASVAALAGEQAADRVRLYSGVFPEHPAVDESELIEQLQSALGLGGVTAEVRAGGMLASAVEAVQAWQLPPAGWGDFWTLPLLRAASSAGVRVMLGGDGGDELFGVRLYLMADHLRAGHALRAARLTRLLPGVSERLTRGDVARMMASVAVSGALPYRLDARLRRPFAARDVPAWLSPALRRGVVDSDDPAGWKRLDGPRWWAEIAHGLTRGIEETGVFEHQRRRAALAGLQARHPLLDLDLVELGLRQPPLATFDRDRSRRVLRAAMAGALPDAVRMRPHKALFDSVLIDTLAGPDGAAVRWLLADRSAELGAYLDLEAMRRELLESDRCRREQPFRWMWQVWRLAAAEIWLRAQAGRAGQTLTEEMPASVARVTLRAAPRSALCAVSSVVHA
jgi:asparagine synthase (glutamine-hydrolysing)